MTAKTILALALALSGACGVSSAKVAREFRQYYKDLPFRTERIARPDIPSRTADIRDFGGVGDGSTLNTEAFASAAAWLEERGGGHLEVPAGVWLTGPIGLKSNMDLHVEKGAVIVFSSDPALYPVIRTSFEGLETRRCTSPIHAEGAHDISITGGGVIDGGGEAWRPVKKNKVTPPQWKAKVASGGVLNEKKDYWFPDEGFRLAQGSADMNVPDPNIPDSLILRFLRPVMVSLRNCENVLLEDCLFQNSPAWNIHPLLCKNLIVKNITVRNPSWSQNGDGIDIESCTDALVLDSTFDCGDDAICIKSGKDEDGRRRGVPTKGLVVQGCTVFSGHGGFVVGSETSGGVKDVMVRDCRFLGTDVGLRFKSRRGRGGTVEDIWIEDILMTDIVVDAIVFDLHYGGKSATEQLEEGPGNRTEKEMPADETTPQFRNIHIKGVDCRGAKRAMYFNGLPEMPIRGIDIRDCRIIADKGMETRWAENVTMENVEISER